MVTALNHHTSSFTIKGERTHISCHRTFLTKIYLLRHVTTKSFIKKIVCRYIIRFKRESKHVENYLHHRPWPPFLVGGKITSNQNTTYPQSLLLEVYEKQIHFTYFEYIKGSNFHKGSTNHFGQNKHKNSFWKLLTI